MEIPKNPNETAELQRAREAEMLLNNPMLMAAIEAIEAHFTKDWYGTKIDEREARETAYMMLKTVGLFRHLLTEHLTTGKLAAAQKDARDVQQAHKDA